MSWSAHLPWQADGGAQGGAAQAVRLSWYQRGFFFLLLPILLSFPQGWSQAGPTFSLPVSVLWWALTWTASWWAFELFSRVAAICLRPWRPPLWLVLLLGALAGGLSARWYMVAMFELLTLIESPPIAEAFLREPRDLSDPTYLLRLAQSLVSGATVWLVANYLFERITRTVRFADATARRAWLEAPAPASSEPRASPAVRESVERPFDLDAPPAPAETSPLTDVKASGAASVAPALPGLSVAPTVALPPPRFLARLTRLAGATLDELLAVEAEDHYIKVHTSRGSELVYYRFADALDDLRGHDGLQVHRSFWVRRGAIQQVDTSGRHWMLVLVNGLCVPVSRANQGAIRLAGLR